MNRPDEIGTLAMEALRHALDDLPEYGSIGIVLHFTGGHLSRLEQSRSEGFKPQDRHGESDESKNNRTDRTGRAPVRSVRARTALDSIESVRSCAVHEAKA